ncbi:PP2C family protein-serine/threonine phosphatase [Pseudonocardia zijingensis]|uniref:SpoIIE family protein phosphatase n=1 Tax=Pseudonocardia zijingensis TaxID=153376 RepID=A0ABP4AVW9_9PSEU
MTAVPDPERRPAIPDETAEELYEYAPCGYLSTTPDGVVTGLNTTLLRWLGYEREQVVGVRRFSDLLTVGGRIYCETHLFPLLQMRGEVGGIALELRTAAGERLPVLVTCKLRTGADGKPGRIRIAVFEARDRRAYEQELLRARQAADRERDQVRRLAAALQRSLLPPVLPAMPGAEVAAHFHAASADEVSGDFYDLFPLPGDGWGIVLGDVCGKGAEAAAVTSLARYTVRAAAVHDADPVAVLRTLNSVIKQEVGDTRFCTVLAGRLTPCGSGYRVELAHGGHPPALLLRADGTADFVHAPGGQLVGVLPDPLFVGAQVDLGPGDTLLLYTDGLTEMRVDASRDRYEEAALREFAAGLAPASAPALVEALRGLLAEASDLLDDDTAVLAVGVPAT